MKTEKRNKKVRFNQFSKILNTISKNEFLDTKNNSFEKKYLLAPLKIKKFKSRNSTIFTERVDDTNRFSLKHKFKDLLKLFSKNSKTKTDFSVEKKWYFLKKQKNLKENLSPKLIERKFLVLNEQSSSLHKNDNLKKHKLVNLKKISFSHITKKFITKKIFNNFEKTNDLKKFCTIIFRIINNKNIILKESLKNNHKLLQNQIGFFLNENFSKFLTYIKDIPIFNLIYEMLILERIVIICLFTIFKENLNILKFAKVILNNLKDNWITIRNILYFDLKQSTDLQILIFEKIFCKKTKIKLKKNFDIDKAVEKLTNTLSKITKNYKIFKKSFPKNIKKKFEKIQNQKQEISLNKKTIKIYRFLALYSIKLKSFKKKKKKKKNYLISTPRPKTKNLTLVLDLDETLIHYDLENSKATLRPNLNNFLKSVSKFFELIIFTAGKKFYADEVIDDFDKEKLIDFRFYRKDTDLVNGVNVKDLSKIGRDMGSLLIVDNIRENFGLQKENGVFIRGFYGEQGDLELFRLEEAVLGFLKRLLERVYGDEGRGERC